MYTAATVLLVVEGAVQVCSIAALSVASAPPRECLQGWRAVVMMLVKAGRALIECDASSFHESNSSSSSSSSSGSAGSELTR